jgi:serine protease SohB
MLEFAQNVGMFLSQTIIIVLGLIAIILTITAVAIKNKNSKAFQIEIINDSLNEQRYQLISTILKDDDLKIEKKRYKKSLKDEKNHDSKPFAYVLNFLEGDVKASGVEQFREEVTNLLLVAKKDEEVIINVESPGGIVHGYGLAAAQILRLRDFGLQVTICIDKVAASGGYMMACTAHKIISAPFAIVGSIGVVAQLPNFNRALKKHDIDYKEYTAGDFKRTVSLFGEITEKGEKKFIEQLEATHILFKKFVGKYRPQLNIDQIATGEYWFGEDAVKLNLVDHIGTSDDYILNKTKTHIVVKMTIEKKTSFSEKISDILSQAVNLTIEKTLQRNNTTQI